MLDDAEAKAKAAALDAANEMMGKFSSGKVKKEQLVQLINHIVSGPMPFW